MLLGIEWSQRRPEWRYRYAPPALEADVREHERAAERYGGRISGSSAREPAAEENAASA